MATEQQYVFANTETGAVLGEPTTETEAFAEAVREGVDNAADWHLLPALAEGDYVYVQESEWYYTVEIAPPGTRDWCGFPAKEPAAWLEMAFNVRPARACHLPAMECYVWVVGFGAHKVYFDERTHRPALALHGRAEEHPGAPAEDY